jgi:hypothetical protein
VRQNVERRLRQRAAAGTGRAARPPARNRAAGGSLPPGPAGGRARRRVWPAVDAPATIRGWRVEVGVRDTRTASRGPLRGRVALHRAHQRSHSPWGRRRWPSWWLRGGQSERARVARRHNVSATVEATQWTAANKAGAASKPRRTLSWFRNSEQCALVRWASRAFIRRWSSTSALYRTRAPPIHPAAASSRPSQLSRMPSQCLRPRRRRGRPPAVPTLPQPRRRRHHRHRRFRPPRRCRRRRRRCRRPRAPPPGWARGPPPAA